MMTFITQKLIDISLSLNGKHKITFECEKLDTAQFQEFVEGKKYVVEIKQHKEKRTLTQNAYLWVMIRSLAERLKLGNTEVYKRMIREYGRFDYISIQDKAVDTFIKMWESKGEGNMCDIKESKLDGCKVLRVFYGSSSYNTEDMATLIDGVIFECQQLGITTMTKEEILSFENENDRS